MYWESVWLWGLREDWADAEIMRTFLCENRERDESSHYDKDFGAVGSF